jgi:hypothetical protein
MPGITVTRHDFRIVVSGAGEAAVTLAWGGPRVRRALSATDLLMTLAPPPWSGPPDLLAPLMLAKEFSAFRATVPRLSITDLPRITVQVDDARAASLDWEALVATSVGGTLDVPVVRVGAVCPRVAQVPFTLPLRVLQIGGSIVNVESAVARAFGRTDIAGLPDTVCVDLGQGHDLRDFALPRGWKTADVVHFGSATVGAGSDAMATGRPASVGTLGWLLRATDVWRTRLVVLEVGGAADAVQMRALAAAIVARGGPAVLVGPALQPDAFFHEFYGSLVHDQPIDQALMSAASSSSPVGTNGASLFAGVGREELIRISGPGLRLNALSQRLSSTDERQQSEAAAELWASLALPGQSAAATARRFQDAVAALDGLRTSWQSLEFDFSERRGFIPLAERIRAIRSAVRPAAEGGTTPEAVTIGGSRAPERFVNPGLRRIADDGFTRPIDPHDAPLSEGEPVVLGIQIGPKDVSVPVLEARALIEEPFKWEQGQSGVWVTIGVSGIDFEVLGEPVQEVWLPRTGASDRVEFSVVPGNAGVQLLRFSIYYGADLLQSFRLAAVVGKDLVGRTERHRALAAVLGETGQDLGGLVYAARLEYAAAPDLADPQQRQKRDDVLLSIFANQVDGRRIYTTRGAEGFAVAINNGVPEIGERIRKRLDEVSTQIIGSSKLYAFVPGTGGYYGTWQQLDEALRSLAAPGWELYSTVIDSDTRAKLQPDLDARPGTVHVGHALLEEVLPWALVYDREYDPDQRRTDGLDALHGTCPAGLFPTATGLPPQCGQHPDCLLHSAQLQTQRANGGPLASPATVVCPRHFWGFRHKVELPPVQVDPGTQNPPPLATKVNAARPAAMMVGYNAKLPQASTHIADLKSLLGSCTISSTVRLETSDRDALKIGLRSPDVDLVYLFCHARGGRADPGVTPPHLELQGASDPAPGVIKAPDLQQCGWSHGPLVFFNGCNTGLFSSDALSPFIRTVVRDSKASGAIGTEIPVFEELAAEVATLFLRRFLNGMQAGEALLEARLDMLQRLNPLGIAYALYAFSELEIVQT